MTFKEWLREKENELQELRELVSLNEIFDYTSDYKEVSPAVYIEYKEKLLKQVDPYFLSTVINLEEKRKREHGPRVHYYKYKDFLIYYGKFKYSNKYEIHFLDLNNFDVNVINGKNNYSTVFIAVMSILKDKHFDKGKSDNISIINTNNKKIDFYEVLIKSILKKYNVNDWFVLKDRRGLVISKNDKIIAEHDDMFMKALISQEDKELIDRLIKYNSYI